MNKEKYQQLLQLLEEFRQREQKVVDANTHGPMYLQMVEHKLFGPLRDVMNLVRVRWEQAP